MCACLRCTALPACRRAVRRPRFIFLVSFPTWPCICACACACARVGMCIPPSGPVFELWVGARHLPLESAGALKASSAACPCHVCHKAPLALVRAREAQCTLLMEMSHRYTEAGVAAAEAISPQSLNVTLCRMIGKP